MPPRLPRFSIAGLVGLVLASGIGFAALRSSTPAWAALFNALAASLLATSILCVAIGRGRVFWTGFAVFGLCYVIFTMTLILHNHLNETDSRHPVDFLCLHLGPPMLPEPRMERDFGSLQNICHAMACLGFAAAGGVLACSLARSVPSPIVSRLPHAGLAPPADEPRREA